MPEFILDSLRGGSDDYTPAASLPKDTCELAENVEFYLNSLGERRAGTAVSALPATLVADAGFRTIMWAGTHTPSGGGTELWIIAHVVTGARMFRSAGSVWTEIAFPAASDKPLIPGDADEYEIYSQSLHNKLFIAYRNSANRLHVWDGTTFRRTGLAANAAPTVADFGVGVYPATIRYYRTRSVRQLVAPTVDVRSEPSPSVAFTPSGGGASVHITRAALPGESETDWELEASPDNIVFYKMDTVAAATTVRADAIAPASYSLVFPQSDPIGTYALIPSVAYLTVDSDRLVTAGDVSDAAAQSAVRWTPVGNDPSPGPDERFNANTDPRVDLDSQFGGSLSGISQAQDGALYAFKSQFGVYELVRTGQLVGAYEAHCLTRSRGALPHSIIPAYDEAGRSATYFVDPSVGPMRIGAPGIQFVGAQVHRLFTGSRTPTSLSPTPQVHGVFYADRQQIHYWVCPSGDWATALKAVLQVNLITTDSNGEGRGGWSTVPQTGTTGSIGRATCSTMFMNSSGRFVPYIGMKTIALDATGVAASDALQVCDTGTSDNGIAYLARLRSRGFLLSGLLGRHGINNAALLGTAGSRVLVNLRRDFGTEVISVSANLTAVGGESLVMARLDNLNAAELFAFQIEFTDDIAHLTQWGLQVFSAMESPEQIG